MDVIVWNMRHQRGNWRALQELRPDIALLSEATAAPPGTNAIAPGETFGRDGYLRPWSAAVAGKKSKPKEISDANLFRYGRKLKLEFNNSRPGSWVAAVVDTADFGPVTAISLYGLMDEKSDSSLHRSLSELAAVFEDKRYNKQVLLGGDLNTWTGWPKGPHLDRDRVVLDRIRAFGLCDCLEKGAKGPLEGCPCTLGDACRHTWTRVDPRYPNKPYQMDYLFASADLASRLQGCKVLNSSEWRTRSDHFPIKATFRM